MIIIIGFFLFIYSSYEINMAQTNAKGGMFFFFFLILNLWFLFSINIFDVVSGNVLNRVEHILSAVWKIHIKKFTTNKEKIT